MRHPRAQLVTEFEKELMEDFDDSLVDDTRLQVKVTYKRFTGSSYDAETATQTPTEDTANAVPAIRGVISGRRAEAVRSSVPNVEQGDREYLIRPSDLTDKGITLPPTREDQIVDGSSTYKLIGWRRDDKVGDMFLFIAREI